MATGSRETCTELILTETFSDLFELTIAGSLFGIHGCTMRQGDQSEIPFPHRVAPAASSRIWTEACAYPSRKRQVVSSSQKRAPPRFPSSAADKTLLWRLMFANGLSHPPFRATRIRSCKMLRQVVSRHSPDPGLGWIRDKMLADLSEPPPWYANQTLHYRPNSL
jgi:hypothetical protein